MKGSAFLPIGTIIRFYDCDNGTTFSGLFLGDNDVRCDATTVRTASVG